MTSNSNPFRTSRVFAQSPSEVFAALAAPERLARWWGPDGFTNTFMQFDFVPGGMWRFSMHGPAAADGTAGQSFPNECRFERIEPNRLVELRHACEPFFNLRIELAAVPQGCLVSWEQLFDDDAFAAAVQHIVEPANEQNLTRWQAELARN